jgi:hypothetical protein
MKMGENRIAKFSEAVMATSGLPVWVRDNVGSARGLEEKNLDRSYLDFLDDQILLASRGPEWTQVLQKRRAALANYCGKNLMSGIVSHGKRNCFIKVDPESKKILYWELWD